MSGQSRLEDLRRRIHKDPASIAFAQLAEECRRAGQFTEAVDVCHVGLHRHPGYVSARVTLGRALVALGRLEEAEAELQSVLNTAPENLAARRGLADVYCRRGDVDQALSQYRAALALAPNDPDLERTVGDLLRSLPPGASSGRPGVPAAQSSPISGTLAAVAAGRAIRMIAALEQWLVAIHVARAQRST